MKKIISIFLAVNFLICGISSLTVSANEIGEIYTETNENRASDLIYGYSLSISNYNGSLCVNARTSSSSVMKEIGLKDLKIQYSYNNSTWYNEWNAGDFLDYDTDEYTLSNYIMAVDRHGCYYRVICKHYAKEAFLVTQSESNASNSVWIS